MYNDPIRFSENLVKGRIAETLFEQMLRDAGGFTILSFGYERILPELAHQQGDIHAQKTMEIIRSSPDFAVIDHESHEVRLIEVKYMMHPNETKILEAAEKMLQSWKPSYLFLATPSGFYFSPVVYIVKSKGVIQPLSHNHISEVLQKKYIGLLNEFITPNEVLLGELWQKIEPLKDSPDSATEGVGD